jgi:hypothetical protein
MPLDHQNVTATISVTGLALGCYNPNTSNWEVAFIRHPRHVLKIRVTKQTAEGPANLTFQVDSRHRIFVEAVKPIPPAQALFTPGSFDRKESGNDPEDLRWVVDLEKELNNNEPVSLKQPEFPVTAMYVSYPVIYADPFKFVLDGAELVRLSDGTDVRPFGKLAEAGNADVRCQDDGAVTLRIDGPLGFSIELPHIAGATHTIEMENLCQDSPGKTSTEPSDFTLYYSAVEDTAGDKFDLKIKNHTNGQGAVCNWVFLGERETLSPLI